MGTNWELGPQPVIRLEDLAELNKQIDMPANPDPPGYETRKAECRGAHCWHVKGETPNTRTEQCCFCGSMLQRSFYEVPDPKHGPYSLVKTRVYADTRRD